MRALAAELNLFGLPSAAAPLLKKSWGFVLLGAREACPLDGSRVDPAVVFAMPASGNETVTSDLYTHAMNPWIRPARRELAVEILIALTLPAGGAALALIDDLAPWAVLLTTLGTVVLVLLVVALWEWVRSPYRRRTLSDHELEAALARWLREAGYGLAAATKPSPDYSFVVVATLADKMIYLWRETGQSTLSIATERSDSDGSARSSLSDQLWFQMLYDIALELGRFGAVVNFSDDPHLKITIQESLTIDADLTEREVIDKVAFVVRADSLGNLIAGKYTTAAQFAQTAVTDSRESHAGSAEFWEKIRDAAAKYADTSARPPDPAS